MTPVVTSLVAWVARVASLMGLGRATTAADVETVVARLSNYAGLDLDDALGAARRGDALFLREKAVHALAWRYRYGLLAGVPYGVVVSLAMMAVEECRRGAPR